MNIEQQIHDLELVEPISIISERVKLLRTKVKVAGNMKISSYGWDSHHDHSNFGDVGELSPAHVTTASRRDEKIGWTDHTDFSDSGVS